MGGDFGPGVTIPAVLRAIQLRPELFLTLVGDQEVLKNYFLTHRLDIPRQISIHHASQVVAMDESPSQALRSKKDSSLRVAIDLVKDGQVMACVSAGNTGALMATARFVLRTVAGIDRPAISAVLPTTTGCVRMLDLGANVDSTPEQLFQFAVMGAVLAEFVDGVPSPRVGLLNIGTEDIKGNDLVKQTAALLNQASGVNYVGYVEGDDIYLGKADVVVCDGFVGNVTLKASEGVARMIAFYLKKAFSENIVTRCVGLLALPVLNRMKKHMDPARYNGASFIGLQGVVVKSHGGADEKAFTFAIDEAVSQIAQNIPQRLNEKLASLLTRG